MKEEFDKKLEMDLTQMNRRYDTEKQELYTEMHIYKVQAENYQSMKDKHEIEFFYLKWFFISKILMVKKCETEEEREILTNELRKKFFNRELQRLS